MDYIKGNRIGSREAELENSSGWKAVRKVHKSKRSYKRKDKHQNKSGNHNPDFFCPRMPTGCPVHRETPKLFPQLRKNISSRTVP